MARSPAVRGPMARSPMACSPVAEVRPADSAPSSRRSSLASRPDRPDTNLVSTASWSSPTASAWLIRLAARLASSTTA